jgi:hypothetical protein
MPEHQERIQWLPSGQAFYIPYPEKFSNTVLPKYFKHGNFASFNRQLNIYGFRKLSLDGRRSNSVAHFDHHLKGIDFPKTPDGVAFAHPMFRKGGWNELAAIKRRTGKDARRKTSYPIVTDPVEV